MAPELVRNVKVTAGSGQQLAIVGGTGALFVVLAGLPLLWPLFAILVRDTGATAESLAVFFSARPWVLLAQSIALSIGVAAGALVLGTPMGILLARTDIVARRVLLFVYGFPVFLPPFLLALGWFYLLGRDGFVGAGRASGLLFHPFGHVAILALAFAPVVTVLVALSLWNLDPRLEDAARVVARPLRVATGILLPSVWRSVALAGILVFALAFSELGVPMFLRVAVYPAAVFSRLGGIDYAPGEAFLLTLPLVPVALALVALEQRLFRGRPIDVLGVQHRSREALPLGARRALCSAGCWLLAVLSLLPLAALTAKAMTDGGFAGIDVRVGRSVVNSLLGSSLAATAIVGLGAVLGHAHARGLPGARWFDRIAVFAFLTPAVVLGVGLVALWNRPETRFVYGGIAILVLGYIARYGVIGIRSVAVAVAQSPASLEDAASAFGAGFARRFVFIVLPLHRRTLLAAWILALVFCMRDLETAVLYYPPGREPLTVRIFTLEANGPEGVVAALSMLHVAVTAVVLTAGGLVLGRWSRS